MIFKTWRDVYSWFNLRAADSFWARQLVDFMRAFEQKMLSRDYQIRGTITVFDGLRFDDKDPYSSREAKRLLRLMGDLLQERKDLQKIGVDPDGKRRAAITVPNGVRGGFRSKLANIGIDGFLDIVTEIELKLRPVIKKSAGAKPMLYATQRHYRSQRSDAEIDGRIDVDLRTAIRGNGTLVKYQPQWVEAIYELLVHKKANIQLGFDVQFLYSCKAIRSAEAVELFADSWIAMALILGLVVDG
jgi:hypothetical protein